MITCEPPPPLALSSLVKAATAHPYRPSGILRALRLADDTRWLLRTAAELVPDHLALIASQPDELARVQTFFNVFEQRYFPLDGYAEDITTGLDDSTGPGNYGETIISYIGERLPVHSLGMDKDGYHQIWDNQRRGLAQVMLFTKPSEYIYGEDGSGLWTAWVEEAHARGAPRDVLEALPTGGTELKPMVRALRGTPFKNLIPAATFATSQSGIPLLDVWDPVEELGTPFMDGWDLETVLGVKMSWDISMEILDAANRMINWLEDDPTWHSLKQTAEYLSLRLAQTKDADWPPLEGYRDSDTPDWRMRPNIETPPEPQE